MPVRASERKSLKDQQVKSALQKLELVSASLVVIRPKIIASLVECQGGKGG